MQIRPRRDSDLDACAAMLARVHAHDTYPARWPRHPVSWIAEPDVHGAWVAVDGPTVIGHGVLQALDPDRLWADWRAWAQATGARLGCLSRLFVDPARRREGVAAALIEVVGGAARERGLTLVLEVADQNAESISYYRRRGWAEVGEAMLAPRDGYDGLPVRLFVEPQR